jgi:CHAT domain-containing protein
MGIAYFNEKKYDEAQNVLGKALNINTSYKSTYNSDKENIMYVLANVCAFNNKYDKAQEYYSKAVDILKTTIERNFNFLTEQERNKYWNYLQEDMQNIFAFGYKMKTFNSPFTTELYNSVLFSKSLLLSSDNEINNLVSKNTDLLIMRNQIERLENEIEKNKIKNADSLIIKRQAIESELLKKCNTLYGNYTRFLSISFKNVVANLNANDAALEFQNFKCGKDSTIYCAFILKRGIKNPIMVPLFEKKDLDNLLLRSDCTFSSAFSDDDDDNHNLIYKSKALGQMVWGKILSYLNDVHNVYFSPSGIFYQLGIENLPLADEKTFSEHYAAYRLSSTRELAVRNKTALSSNKAYLYGGLQYDETPQIMDEMSCHNRSREVSLSDNLTLAFGDSLSLYKRALTCYNTKEDTTQNRRDALEIKELPYTKEEVEDINTEIIKYQKADNKDVIHSKILTGTEGNEESFKALSGTHPKIIHIATHGFFLPETEANKFSNKRSFLTGFNDMQQEISVDNSLSRSGLLLAGAKRAWMGETLPDSVNDGILTAKEIAHMDLGGTDLVVLSACDTGLGDITGDGVFGLQRGFKEAGVNTLVMSLWKVDDKATEMIMTQFYGNLMKGETKRTAFLNAQNYLRTYTEMKQYKEKITVEETDAQKEKEREEAKQGETTIIHPYSSPQYWAAFIMLDGIN